MFRFFVIIPMNRIIQIDPKDSLRFLILITLVPAILASCNEQVDLYADAKPTPIVYCLLNPADSVQYLRIGRSFMAGADVAAQIPPLDSTVWTIPHEAYIEEYHTGDKINRYRFEPNFDIPKDSGFFPVANLRLYSASFRPVPGNAYRLYVYFPDLDRMVSARINVHGLPQIVDPLPLSIRKVNFEPGQLFTIRWNPGPNTGVYQMIFRIHYRDSSSAGREFKSADYTSGGLFNQQEALMQESYMGGPAFFNAMSRQVPVAPDHVREVVSVEFIMVSGGTDLGFLYRSDVETGTVFTNLGTYSNLLNGLGLFSSRTELHIPNLMLSEVTIDLLAHGETTSNLGFRDSKGN